MCQPINFETFGRNKLIIEEMKQRDGSPESGTFNINSSMHENELEPDDN